MQSDDPAFLPVGTDVSAKFKGAFCEARVKKIQKSVKCKVMFKDAPFGSASYDDTQIKGSLELNAIVEVPHGKTSVRAVVQHIKDGSSYTVVFNDGDERSLRRSQLCLKSGKHFDAAGNLDALPLTHPEQFSNPVMSDGKTHKLKQKKRKSQYRVETSESSSEESDSQKKDAGKVMCVFDEPSKKGKWFPAIIASPKAHKTSKLPGKNDVVVRSFKDGKYSVVPLACTTEFDVVKGRKIEQPASLKQAVEKAIAYSDRDELPSHWDRDAILGVGHDSSDDDAKPSQKRKKSVVVASSSEDSDSASEYSEERDRFVAQLYKFQEERGTPINKAPILGGRDLDLYRFYKVVQKMGGFNRVCNNNAWKQVLARMKLEGCPGATPITVRNSYSRYLSHFNSFYRRLGWRMDEISVAGTSRTSRQVRQAEKDKAKARKPPAAAADKDKDQKEKEQKEKDAEKEKDAKEKAKEKESKEKAKEKEKDVKEKAKEAKEKEKEAKEKEKEAKEREKEAKEKEKEAKEKEKEAKEKEKEAKEREKEKEREKNKEKEKQEKQNLSSSDKEKESKEKASEKKKDDKVKPKSHSPPPPPPSVSPRAPPEDDQDPDDGFVQGTLTTRFYIGQKVRAQHGQGSARRWYDARVLQLDVGPTVGAKTATKRCFLHYLGWNMRYDEWVGTAKIRVSMAV
uniref:ARID domain-containing protein n=1 Tax=Plectus sambesii TaxID=2011161 RepID=A0A914X6A4_9BILA